MKFIFAGISVLLTAVLIVLVRLVDVAAIGPEGTSIGLSHLNQAVHDLSGVNIFWYDITEWFGIVAILIAGLFALTGLVQLVKGRSIRNVDKEILALGALYMVVIGLYGLFEIVIVNYRPVIMPDEVHPEASFPSSHTALDKDSIVSLHLDIILNLLAPISLETILILSIILYLLQSNILIGVPF